MNLIVVAPDLQTRLAVQRALGAAPPLLSTVSVAGALAHARQSPADALLLCPPLTELDLPDAAAQAQAQGLKVFVLGSSELPGVVAVSDLTALPRLLGAGGPASAPEGEGPTPSPPAALLSAPAPLPDALSLTSPALPSPALDDTPLALPYPVPALLLGASTGGPSLLTQILSALPGHFPAAVVVAQHIVEGFGGALAASLQEQTSLRVREAVSGERYRPGHVYFAPVGHHIGLGRGGTLELDPAAPHQGYRPSIDHLFVSACQLSAAQVAAAVLTGMGQDGAEGLRQLSLRGALTIVQDPATATVASMPEQALALGAPTYVLPPSAIPAIVLRWAERAAVPPGLPAKPETR